MAAHSHSTDDVSLPADRELRSAGMLFVDEPHPATLPDEELAAKCDVQRTRRSGPGGQHRNKVESAIVLTHRPTGVEAQASERRSQHENRSVALFRLRCSLAIRARSRWVEPFTTAINVHPMNADAADAAGDRADSDVTALPAAQDQTGVELSTESLPPPDELWTNRCKNQRISVNPEHADFPHMLVTALDMIAACTGETRTAAAQLGVTTTQLHRFCQLEPAAWQWLAAIRAKHKLPTLK